MNLILISKRFVSSDFRKFCYNLSGFNKLGLWRDDLLNEDLSEVQEALERLDPRIRDERNYRIIRACQLNIEKKILPRSQWTKFKDDKLYLTPIVEDILKEREEVEEWNKRY
ncbi:hypothetical protein HHI36_016477 [Cryptolaemus montrouzieri]|uniref:Cytochrome b-c1 complex subunit 7 n=1 Tax=Cryptolaemus montrouzieri TaxID=559131 RepID=A0ABD2NK98_9CUCU